MPAVSVFWACLSSTEHGAPVSRLINPVFQHVNGIRLNNVPWVSTGACGGVLQSCGCAMKWIADGQVVYYQRKRIIADAAPGGDVNSVCSHGRASRNRSRAPAGAKLPRGPGHPDGAIVRCTSARCIWLQVEVDRVSVLVGAVRVAEAVHVLRTDRPMHLRLVAKPMCAAFVGTTTLCRHHFVKVKPLT